MLVWFRLRIPFAFIIETSFQCDHSLFFLFLYLNDILKNVIIVLATALKVAGQHAPLIPVPSKLRQLDITFRFLPYLQNLQFAPS